VKKYGEGVHPLSITGVPMAITALVMGPFAYAVERHQTFAWNPVSVGALVYLALFGSAVTFSLYFWLLRQYPAKRVALIAYIIPLVAVSIGILRGEPLTARTLVGSAIVVAGVALSVHQHGRQAVRAAPTAGPHQVGEEGA
jgi:drug/metabolite transporter (DMT)-like permease